jgi:selenocysteine lyase/cysteine desulfurase
MDAVAAHERRLAARLWDGLGTIPGLRRLTLWPSAADRVGVATFNVDGYRDPLLAAVLSAEHAIAVRHGCFCAHPLMSRLLNIPEATLTRLHAELAAGGSPALPGAVRASIGIGTTEADVDRLVQALYAIAQRGPRARYEHSSEHDEYVAQAVRTAAA